MQDESGREYVTYPARRITEGTDVSPPSERRDSLARSLESCEAI